MPKKWDERKNLKISKFKKKTNDKKKINALFSCENWNAISYIMSRYWNDKPMKEEKKKKKRIKKIIEINIWYFMKLGT